MTETMDLLTPRSGEVESERDGGRIDYAYSVRVGELAFSRCDAAEVDYDRDGSGSCRIVVADDGLLRDTEGETLRAFFRSETTDGSHLEYFTGRVRYARHDPESGRTTLEAFGPKESLSGTFNEPTLYRGVDLSFFVSDIRRRLGPKLPRVRVIGGERVRIQDTAYNREVEFGEALDDFTESVGYIVADRPGYELLVAPRPRTGDPITGEARASIGPSDYSPGSLRIERVEEGPYYAVGAFRRENGREVWSITVRVKGAQERGAHPSDVMWLSDFEGDYATAKQQCYALAEAYSRGRFRGSGREITAMPVYPGTALSLSQDETKRDGDYVVTERIRSFYSATCENVSLDLVTGVMDISFSAELDNVRVLNSAKLAPLGSPHVISSEDVEVNNVDMDGVGGYFSMPPVVPEGEVAWYGEDEIGGYIDMTAAEDRAGEDEIGGWVDLDA